jgi:hypothetical protein
VVHGSRPEVWDAASRSGEAPRIFCIGCIENRIGRRLTPDDFADLEINRPGWICSERLIDRLGAP